MMTRRISKYAKELGIPFILSPVQLKILHYLFIHSNEIVYQRDIESVIDSRRSTTSGILNTMEKNNLIKRLNSMEDARSKKVILTDYSYQLFKDIQKEQEFFEEKVSELITPDELEIFFKVTEKIKTNIMNMK